MTKTASNCDLTIYAGFNKLSRNSARWKLLMLWPSEFFLIVFNILKKKKWGTLKRKKSNFGVLNRSQFFFMSINIFTWEKIRGIQSKTNLGLPFSVARNRMRKARWSSIFWNISCSCIQICIYIFPYKKFSLTFPELLTSPRFAFLVHLTRSSNSWKH